MNVRVKISLLVTVPLGIVGVIAWVVAGLPSTFAPDNQPVGYIGQPTVSSHILYTGNNAASRTRLYAIDYDARDWSGNLHSFPLSAAGALISTDDWTNGAAASIDVQSATGVTITSRKIITRDGTTNIQFRWSTGAGISSKLSSFQKKALDPATSITGGNPPTFSPVLDYVRGDRSNETPHGNRYRSRSTVLGDIIHSTPIYCDAADCTSATVFVGANDGMLHAINPVNGSERFAYIPSSLICSPTPCANGGTSKLAGLTPISFTHQYFVDGRMDLRKFGGQTILAGALGGGGKALFALDVTNAAPASETAAVSTILWEITDETTGFAGKLGYTYGQPVLATVVTGAGATPVFIVNNGYGSTNGRASLFLINATTGALIQELAAGTDGSSSDGNGLSSPTVVDTDGDGKADYAYAGDLFGNLFKFQLTSPYAVTKLFTVDTSPVQSINMAPGVAEHPNGGLMITFATGRMLLPADQTDASTYYAYGIWDGAPNGNTLLLTQTLAESNYTGASPAIRVRTATSNVPNWGSGGHKGWKTALPIAGERVVGDGAYVAGRVFNFMSTNPTITATPPTPSGENWWMQLNALTGGDNNGVIRFDLDGNGNFTTADQVSVSGSPTSPVGRNMGGGLRSQLTAISAGTFVVYQSNYDKNTVAQTPDDSGISGGHFDYDIYYYSGAGIPFYTPSGGTSTGNSPFCLKTTDVNNEINDLSPTYCKTANGFPSGYGYMSALTTGALCGGGKANLQTITCSQYKTGTTAGTNYGKKQHVHEYDDKYDVTGVNMLHPSDSSFKLTETMITDSSTQFKILVMNQFVNPAARLAVGTGAGASEESVKTYGGLASQTDPTLLLNGLTTYTTATLGSFVFDLPKTAFQSKDWWGSGGDGQARAGLIPTQTGCVNGVGRDGVSNDPGPNGEKSNGALTIQLIKPDTPATSLELNRPGDVRFGWRVIAADFTKYVLGEYTTFWHHPNGKCFGQTGWIPNPPQDAASRTQVQTGASDAADPRGTFGGPGGGSATVVSVVRNNDGSTTTTYSNGTVVITYPDGSSKTTTSDGAVSWNIPGVATGGVVDATGGVTPEVVGPGEALGRITWRELRR